MNEKRDWQIVHDLLAAATATTRFPSGRWAVDDERHEAWKQECVRLGLEVLTPTACAYLYDRSPTTVRAARRKEEADAVAFTLNLGGDRERDMHLLRLGWAETKWPRPKDFADRLALLRKQGEVIGFSGGLTYLVLSPTSIRSTGDPEVPLTVEKAAAERRDRARQEILKARGKYQGASGHLDAARSEDTEIERLREAESDARLERSTGTQPGSRSTPSIEL